MSLPILRNGNLPALSRRLSVSLDTAHREARCRLESNCADCCFVWFIMLLLSFLVLVLFCAALKAARLLHRGRSFRLHGYYTVQKNFIFFGIISTHSKFWMLQARRFLNYFSKFQHYTFFFNPESIPPHLLPAVFLNPNSGRRW